MSLFFGDGAAASLSVSLGKNETEHIHQTVGNSILFSFLGGLAIILISYFWGDGLLRLIGATAAFVVVMKLFQIVLNIAIGIASSIRRMESRNGLHTLERGEKIRLRN